MQDDVIAAECISGLKMLASAKSTQYSGGELDYAMAWGINERTSFVTMLPTTQSDHRAILVRVNFH